MPVPPPALAPDRAPPRADAAGAADDRVHAVLIVGSGFGGIGAAARLRAAGIADVVVLERADDVGGTWRDNTYPGCACDVESALYSLSFAPNPEWSRSYAAQPEIQAYLRRVAREWGVLPLVRFGHDVRGARWDAAERCWHVGAARGAGAMATLRARVLVLAQGALSDPRVPALPGLERFRGPCFHSARWDHGVDLAGRRVAVVGTGASAAQFVPELQPRVARLTVYQRTPPWVLPRPDRDTGPAERALFRRVPAAQRVARAGVYARRELLLLPFRRPAFGAVAEAVARWHLRRSVADPALREALTPRYRIGCKRVILSNTYLPALARPNVEVVAAPVVGVAERAVVSADGAERAADVLIFGTGFRPTATPLAGAVRGRDGRTLAEAWGGSPRAYAGTTVPGFPNLFLLMGPNTALGHTSVVYMLEAQIAHLVGALAHMRARGVDALEPRAEAEARWTADVERRSRGTAWTAGGCASWYLDAAGRNSALWPDFSWRFRRRVARFDARAYRAEAASAASLNAGAA